MTDRKISALAALTAPASNDYLPIIDISEPADANKNKRISIEELLRGAPSGTAGAPGIAFEGDDNTGIYNPSGDQLAISTGGSERVRLDGSGRVGIGTSSPGSLLDLRFATSPPTDNGVGNDVLRVWTSSPLAANTGGAISLGGVSTSGGATAAWGQIAGRKENATSANYAGYLQFATNNGGGTMSEYARITSGGWFKSSNTGNYYGINAAIHEFNSDQNNGALKIHSQITSGYTDAVLTSEFTGYAPNNTSARFFYCGDTTAERLTIRSNGGIANYSSNNVNLSDRNAKKDIAPAAGTWDCLKAREIVNFRYKDQPEGSDLNLGVIAQQVAESCPEVITVFQEAKEATENHPAQEERLGVKDQQMMWMAIKALQEAQLRIEALEAQIAAMHLQLDEQPAPNNDAGVPWDD